MRRERLAVSRGKRGHRRRDRIELVLEEERQVIVGDVAKRDGHQRRRSEASSSDGGV